MTGTSYKLMCAKNQEGVFLIVALALCKLLLNQIVTYCLGAVLTV